jgi:hemolysin III
MEAARALRRWTVAEEIAHAVSHGVGALLAIGGLAGLVAAAALRGSAWHVTSSAVFGTTLVLLYVASTLYHAIPIARAKRVLRVLDHSAIYLLIAGTYTPFVLGPLRGAAGWTLFGIVWGGALAGIVFKAIAVERAPVVSTVIYALLGWVVVFAYGPLLRAVEPGGLALLVAGGLCYTVGIGFYAWHRLRFGHFVWHLLVMAGSVLHYLAVLLYVIPRTA